MNENEDITKFILMNKDNIVGQIDCSEDTIKCISNININVEERFAIEYKRHNILELTTRVGINNLENLLSKTKGISLNDTLWVKGLGDELSWDDVNPYKNRFDIATSEILLGGKSDEEIETLISPEYRTSGTYPKCWERLGDDIYLVKGGELKTNGISGNSSYCEYFACQVTEALGLKYYVGYNLYEDTDKKRAYTKCNLFTDEEYGYLSIGESKYRKLNLGGTFSLMQQLGNEKEFREMLLLDSLIYNIDRHKGNYGFIIDNRNYKIVKMAPIFDNNLAFLSTVSLQDRDEVERHLKIDMPYTLRHTDLNDKSFVRQGKIAINNCDDLRKRLYNMQDFKLDRTGIKYLEQERMDFMDSLIQNQVKAILKNC